jgi:antitoxin component of RelBE/YafQ-DinJ toxin-antitoxin module
MKKQTQLNLRIESEIKRKLKQKADNLNISLTSYIEKIALEPVIFLDSNSRVLLEALKLNSSV